MHQSYALQHLRSSQRLLSGKQGRQYPVAALSFPMHLRVWLCMNFQVREALITAALLTLPHSVPYRTKAAAVDQILQELVSCLVLAVMPFVKSGNKLCPGSQQGLFASAMVGIGIF